MPYFVRVTTPDGKQVWINFSEVETMRRDGMVTTAWIGDEKYQFREQPEDIVHTIKYTASTYLGGR